MECVDNDPLTLQLHKELRALRRNPEGITLHSIASAIDIVDYLGEGSVEQAYTALMAIRHEHNSTPDGPIEAFFRSGGIDTPGDSLDARLNVYAEEFYVDPRTARRRSDRGAVLISRMIRDTYETMRPWGHIALMEKDRQVLFIMDITLPKNSYYRRPVISVNGIRQQRRTYEFNDAPVHPEMLQAKEEYGPFKLIKPDAGDNTLFEVEAHWKMDIWPSWALTCELRSPNLYSRLAVDRAGLATVLLADANLID